MFMLWDKCHEMKTVILRRIQTLIMISADGRYHFMMRYQILRIYDKSWIHFTQKLAKLLPQTQRLLLHQAMLKSDRETQLLELFLTMMSVPELIINQESWQRQRIKPRLPSRLTSSLRSPRHFSIRYRP